MTQEGFYISKDQRWSSIYECFFVILGVGGFDIKILNLQFVVPIQVTLENNCCKGYCHSGMWEFSSGLHIYKSIKKIDF